MSEYRIVVNYAQARGLVWRALTEPSLIPLWTSTGRGGRTEGFSPHVGTEFRLVAKPMPGWGGMIRCQVLEVEAPALLRYSWLGDEGDDVTIVTCRLEADGPGTRFTWEHTGFTGVGGFIMARVLGSVRKKMLTVGLPALLERMAAEEEIPFGGSVTSRARELTP